MNRRQFLLRSSASAIALAFSSRSMAAMPAAHTMPTASAPVPLMAADAIPAGSPLAPLSRLANRSKRIGEFRATLEAAVHEVTLVPGINTTVWAYQGAVPGPLIEVMEGDQVEIRFINRLPQASTIHWHGLPVPPAEDGNPWDLVPPGGERVYRFTLPEGSAGTYWYHPHPHGDTPEQVYRGLAGVFIVRARHDPLAGFAEQHLVISDLRLDREGRIPGNTAEDWMNGREGQYVLVNGQREPCITLAGRQRLRLWNACSARYLRLSLGGMPFWLVGTDGGLLEAPQRMSELLLAPGERAEWVVDGAPGQVVLTALAYDRQKMGEVADERDWPLARVEFVPGPRPELPSRLRSLEALSGVAARQRVEFSETMSMENGQHEMAFLVNGKAFDMNRIDLVGKVGRVEEWELVNDSHMDHPFHLHGTQFQVISRSEEGKDVAEPFLAWRDTVNLAPQQTVRVRLRQAFSGLRMFHCHILEHEGQGMMGVLEVKP